MAAPWHAYALVALGSAVGGAGRFWVNNWITHRFGTDFPYGTVAINITGSALIGFLAALTGPGGRLAHQAHLPWLLMSGVCGGYTTFSAFSLQTVELLQLARWGAAAANVAASVTLCLLGTWAGWALGRWWNP